MRPDPSTPAPVHLFEVGLASEERFAGMAESAAALAPTAAQLLSPTKQIRIDFRPRERWLAAVGDSCRQLAEAVDASLREGARCAILGGECTLVAGSVPGALPVIPDLVLVYFDAHGDFNTLATTPSHFAGGMCLAHVCGHQLAPLTWPRVRTIADDRVALVGARDLDPGEIVNLDRSRVKRIAFDPAHPAAPGLIEFLRGRPAWVHVDIDVVDPSEIPAVSFPVPGGPSLGALRDVLRQIARVSDVRGVELCAYDPRKDPGGVLRTALADTLASAFS